MPIGGEDNYGRSTQQGSFVCAGLLAALALTACQRDDEIVLEKKFGACKVEALRTIPNDPDTDRIVIDPERSKSAQDDYIEACMNAAGYKLRTTLCEHFIWLDEPINCFDDGGHLVPTKVQQKDWYSWLVHQWQWLKWKFARS